jgi:ATP-binding cassette subfamily F protein 3
MIDFINLSVEFGLQKLFSNINLKINPSDKTCLVGSNGSGKTTLLKIILGIQNPSSGTLQKQGGIKIGYLPQELISFKGKSLFEQVKSSMHEIVEMEQKERELNQQLYDKQISDLNRSQILEQLGELNHQKERIEYFSADSRVEKILMGLGFEEKDFLSPVETFSGGWQMRIQLASILLGDNNLLLLDEPTNHLDIDSLEWLIEYLNDFNGALCIVSHDKHFINNVTDKTIEIFNKTVTYYKGNYNSYLNYKKERDSRIIAQFDYQQKKIKETQKFIERFRYKNTKAKQVQSRIKQLEKLDRVELPDEEKVIRINFPDPPKSSVVPIKLENISKSYGENKVFSNFNFQIERGDKIAFVGPNGAGKTTLAKIIANRVEINDGNVIRASNTDTSFFAQETTEEMDLDNSVLEEASAASENSSMMQIRSVLGSFLFNDDDMFKKVKVLSGGEKSRLALAKILLTKSNLVVLDEPTNHLDVSSKEIFQKALINYSSNLIIISHDIDFLRPIVKKVFEINKDSNYMFHGDIDYYLFKRKDKEKEKAKSKSEIISPTNKRKDQKRIEAALRNEKYSATKDIINKIKQIENKIANAEKDKIRIENKLADSGIYKNPAELKDINSNYNIIKEELNILYERWAILSDDLEKIESRFKD